MSASKHTPGPWQLLVHPREIEASGLPVLIRDDAAYVFGVNESARLANARLIAAAPDYFEATASFLAACVALQVRLPPGAEARLRQLAAVHAKAEGRP